MGPSLDGPVAPHARPLWRLSFRLHFVTTPRVLRVRSLGFGLLWSSWGMKIPPFPTHFPFRSMSIIDFRSARIADALLPFLLLLALVSSFFSLRVVLGARPFVGSTLDLKFQIASVVVEQPLALTAYKCQNQSTVSKFRH